jgi:hypothetical protein
VEFQHFVELVSLQHAASLGRRSRRFRALEEAFAFHESRRADDALQFDFGNGPTLLYSLAPTGEVIVLIYPAKSDLHQAGEDCIALRAGCRTSYQLRIGLARDLRDLVAYGHVTSLNGHPTWRERLRIKWLRWTRGLSVADAGVTPSPAPDQMQEVTTLALRTTAKATAVTIALSVVVIAVIALLAWLACPQLALKVGAWTAAAK